MKGLAAGPGRIARAGGRGSRAGMRRRVHAEIELILGRSAWAAGVAVLAVVVLAGCAPAVRLGPIGFEQ